jgi:hypothetical protein
LKKKPNANKETARGDSRSDQAAAAKRKKYDEGCARAGWAFQPIVGDTYGAYRADARKFFGQLLTKLQKKQAFEDPSRVAANMWRSLSAATVWRAARQLSRLSEVVESSQAPPANAISPDSQLPADHHMGASSNMGILTLTQPSLTQGPHGGNADEDEQDDSMRESSRAGSADPTSNPMRTDENHQSAEQ